MLAADAELQVGPRRPALLGGDRTSSPTPSVSSVTNGSFSIMPFWR